MATLPRVPTGNNKQYTLDSQAAAGASSITLNQSVAGVVRTPGYCVIDRIDTSSKLTPTKREYKYFTGVSGAQLTGVTSVDGTDQVHAVGAIVEFVPDVKYEQDWYDWAITDHSTLGAHVSLISLSVVKTLDFVGASGASINLINTRTFGVASLASLRQAFVGNLLSASGASIQAFPQTPVWVYGGTVSGASAALGMPLDMINPGTIQWITAVSRSGSSNASLFLDIIKNGTTVLTGANASQSVLMIPANGTFVSTASIAVPRFNSGDVFSFSVLGSGSMATDLTVKFYAR